jgi:hypothetical protein
MHITDTSLLIGDGYTARKIHGQAHTHISSNHFVVFSRKSYHVKRVDINTLKQSSRGLEKLAGYAKDKRLGYVDSNLGLHADKAQLEQLQVKQIDKIAYKNTEKTQGISPLLLQNATVIDDEEYAELQQQIASFILETQLMIARKALAKVYTIISDLADPLIVAAGYLEMKFEQCKHNAIRALLQKWSETDRENDARSKEEAEKQLVFDIIFKDLLLKKQIARREIETAGIESEAINSKKYQYACLHPEQPAAAEQFSARNSVAVG